MYFMSRYEKKLASPNYSAIFFSTYTQVSPSLKPFSINNGKDIGLHQAYTVKSLKYSETYAQRVSHNSRYIPCLR